VITGKIDNIAFEFFEGLAGNDVIDGGNAAAGGGRGSDGVFYGNAPAGIVANLATGQVQDGFGTMDTLSHIETLGGSNFDDVLIGGNPANDGYEEFQGRAGDDQIDGGSGFDRVVYQFDGGPRGIHANLTTGTAIDSHGDTDMLVNVESLSGTSFADQLVGSAAPFEQFRPLGGDYAIDGRGGTDQVDYSRSPASVVVDLRGGTARDGYGGTDSLSNLEEVRGSGFADRIAGDRGDNRLEGNAGEDTLAGRGGSDLLDGGTAGDELHGGGHADVLRGAGGADLLDGGRGADTLDGGTGRDVLIGGLGSDLLTGGAGADVFRYTQANQGFDTITDLRGRDIIDIAQVLSGFAEGTSDVRDFVTIVDGGADAILQVDPDGGGDGFRALAVISGGAGASVDGLIAAGNLTVSDGATS
jgi:Ca2+-binding RTX toxin-like protein